MKKLLFTIFAHPDDESFGPSGTLIKEIRENGVDVHLITLTCGQNGTNPDNVGNLGEIRLAEWYRAGELIGASSSHYLGYMDGELCNLKYHEIAEKINAVIDEVIARYSEPVEVEFMTNDLNGISGHIDHIVAGRIACFVFYGRKESDTRFTRIRLACIPSIRLATHNIGWLYMEAGRNEHEIDEIVDARTYREDILAVMRAHHSQRQDCESNLAAVGDDLGLNYFMIRT